ncbi:MAG: sigma-70 family RNA polymerase sigma factor [Planctomycetaceae bacterium]
MAFETDRVLIGQVTKLDCPELPWIKFFATYAPLIRHWIAECHLSSHDAEDLLGEIYLRLVRSLRSFVYDPRQRFRGWLRVVVRSSVSEFCRKTSVCKENEKSVGPAHVSAFPIQEYCRDSAEFESPLVEDISKRILAARSIIEEVRCRVHRRTWNAFYLTEIEGMDIAVVAKKLRMTVGNVCIARYRVRASLKKHGEDVACR